MARCFGLFATAMLLSAPALAAGEAVQSFALSGPVYQAGTTAPLLDSHLLVQVQILNPDKTCVLYEEQQYVDTRTTVGNFNIQVGSSSSSTNRSAGDPGNSMAVIYQNITAIPGTDVSGQNCGGSYSPAAGDTRYFRVTFTPSATGVADTMNPDIVLGSVPSALVAQSLEGVERSSLLLGRTDDGYALSQASLESLFKSASSLLLPGGATGSRPASAVNGMIRYNSTLGKIEAYENGSWVQFSSSSDARLKTNVVGMQDGLERVSRMRPVFFDWDFRNAKAQGYSSKHQVGFIAQELESVLPEVVNQGGDGYRTVEYGKIVPVTVGAIQQLATKLKTVEAENAALKRRLDLQTRELRAIKEKLGIP